MISILSVGIVNLFWFSLNFVVASFDEEGIYSLIGTACMDTQFINKLVSK